MFPIMMHKVLNLFESLLEHSNVAELCKSSQVIKEKDDKLKVTIIVQFHSRYESDLILF